MARLPEPGGDAGQWGEILNDFLSQSISADGSLNISSVGAVQLKPNAVTTAAIADDQVTSSKLTNGSVTTAKIADGQVTASKIADGAVGGNQLADSSVTPAKASAFGEPSGFASLDGDGKLPEAQVPVRLSEAGLSGTIPEQASTLATPTRGQLARIGKAATGKYRVVLGGTSKAAAADAPIRAFALQLQQLFGRARTVVQTFMLDGGANGVYLGWQKQHYAGPGFCRVRGDSASTVRAFTSYGDTATVYFSREENAEPVNITIDDVVVGQTPSPGAQAFGVKQVFSGLSATARHTLTVSVPAGSGYVYMERMEFSYAADTGVEIVDLTKGGSSLWNMTRDWPAAAGEVAPVPLVAGTSGVGAWLEPNADLFIGQWTVNDAGSHDDLVAQFGPNWTALADRALVQGQQMISVIEMGGHFASPGDPNHRDFMNLVAIQRALASRNNVTVVDFHAETVSEDILAYAARYFPGASNVNPAAGTYTGDFIHESDEPYGACLTVMCVRAAIPVPQAVLASSVQSLTRNASIRSAVPKMRVATVSGQIKNLPEIGTTFNPVTNTSVPLLSDVSVASSLNTLVTSATTSDAFGQYRLTNDDFRSITLAVGITHTVTVVSAGNATVRLDNSHVIDEFGNEIPYSDVGNKRTTISAGSGTYPLTWSFQVGNPDGAPALVFQKPAGLGWKLYGVWISPSSTPIIHPTTASDGLLRVTGQVVSPGVNSYADTAGIALGVGVWTVAVTAVRADNSAHGATATYLVTNGGGRVATQVIGAAVASNSLTALSRSTPASGIVRAAATANAGGYTVSFTYTATRLAATA